MKRGTPQHFSGHGVQLFQAFRGCYPQSPLPVLRRDIDASGCNAAGIIRIVRVPCGSAAGGIKPVKPLGCRQPQDSPVVLTYAVNGSGEFIRKLCIDAVMFEGLCRRVEAVEKPITAHPQGPGAIDKQTAHIDAAQAVRPARLMFEDLCFISVIPIEPVLCAEPHESNFVLYHPGDPGLRQACTG